MQALDRKLLRDLARLWSQSLAIAMVLGVGVAIMVMMAGAERSLRETRDTFYERNSFAQIFATVTRAPKDLLGRIEAIDGVARAETRISRHATLDIDGMTAPAMGQLLSWPTEGARLNRPSLTSGAFPEQTQPDAVVVNDSFAKAHGFTVGDRFHAVINGQLRALTLVGTALSPEFIYTIGPGSIMPDDRRFGVIWMGEDALASAFNLTGAFNDISLVVERTGDQNEIIRQLDLILAPYGGTGAYLRKDQQSNTFLDAELTQLSSTIKVVPPIFLIISAFLVNMVLGRLIALEREQIGLLMALGYHRSEIAWHYIKMSLVIGAVGVALGWGFGLWAGRGIAVLYAQFFHFPYLVYVPYPSVYALSALAGLAAAMLGAVFAVRKAVGLTPAVAMAPPRADPLSRRLDGPDDPPDAVAPNQHDDLALAVALADPRGIDHAGHRHIRRGHGGRDVHVRRDGCVDGQGLCAAQPARRRAQLRLGTSCKRDRRCGSSARCDGQ